MFEQSGVLITGGTFNSNVHNTSTHVHGRLNGFERLQSEVAPCAFHNSGDRFDPPKCYPNTRVAILNRIMDWILQRLHIDALIMWLYGPAGAGKSAIAQTIAEMCHTRHLLLASFFFSRTDTRRNNGRSLIPTLTYQIALAIPETRPTIEDAVESDPLIFSRSLEAQLEALIVRPIQKLVQTGVDQQIQFPRLIIIDGLDECENHTVQRNIVCALADTIQKYELPIRVLVASRPEVHLSSTFNHTRIKDIVTPLTMDDGYQSESDIHLFLRESFDDIQLNHPLRKYIPPGWPSAKSILTLVQKSSGQFIYAATVVKYVNSDRHKPTDRLEIVVGIRPPRNAADLPFAELDALYTHIFSSLEDINTTLRILGTALVLPYPWTFPSRIESILGLESGDVELFLGDISALVRCADNPTRVQFFHASLGDFLCNPGRSGQAYVNLPLMHTEFVRCELRRRSNMEILGFDSLRDHLPKALLTEELLQDLFNFPICKILEYIESRGVECMVWFFEWLILVKNLPLNDNECFYRQTFTSCQRIWFHKLEIFHSYPRASILLSLYTLPRRRFYGIFGYEILVELFNRRVPRDKFSLWANNMYKPLVVQLLTSEAKSGVYTLDRRRYADAALYFLKYICHHTPSPPDILSHVAQWSTRSKQRPWISRCMRTRHTLHECVKEQWDTCLRWSRIPKGRYLRLSGEINASRRRVGKRCLPLQTTLFTLGHLPQLLAGAESCEELTEFVLRCTFRLGCHLFPSHVDRVERAIEKYLSITGPDTGSTPV